MRFRIINPMCLYISFNAIVTALDKSLTENFGAAIINLALEGCFKV